MQGLIQHTMDGAGEIKINKSNNKGEGGGVETLAVRTVFAPFEIEMEKLH